MTQPNEADPQQIRAAGINLPQKRSGNVNAKTGQPWTEGEIAERRLEVWEMRCQGIPVTEMAKRWKVSRQTIHNDIKVLEKRFRERIEGLYSKADRQAEEMGDIIATLETISENAFLEYALAATPSAKDKLLNTAMRAQVNKAKLMMDLGLLPKSKDAHEVTVNAKVTFSQRFGEKHPITVLEEPAQRRKVLDVAERIFKLRDEQGQLPEIVLDPNAQPEVVIDASIEDSEDYDEDYEDDDDYEEE